MLPFTSQVSSWMLSFSIFNFACIESIGELSISGRRSKIATGVSKIFVVSLNTRRSPSVNLNSAVPLRFAQNSPCDSPLLSSLASTVTLPAMLSFNSGSIAATSGCAS